MIWTEAQLNAVRHLRSAITIQTDHLIHPNMAKAAAAEKAIAALAEAAHVHAADISEADIQVTFEEQTELPGVHMRQTRVTAWWWPTTTEVEISGGHADGTIMQVPDVHRPLLMPEPPALSTATTLGDEPYPTTALTHAVLVYERRRWNPATRRWVFDLARRHK